MQTDCLSLKLAFFIAADRLKNCQAVKVDGKNFSLS